MLPVITIKKPIPFLVQNVSNLTLRGSHFYLYNLHKTKLHRLIAQQNIPVVLSRILNASHLSSC